MKKLLFVVMVLAFPSLVSADRLGSIKSSTEVLLSTQASTPGVINTSTNPVDWSNLKNVPAGFADGTDDGAGSSGVATSTVPLRIFSSTTNFRLQNSVVITTITAPYGIGTLTLPANYFVPGKNVEFYVVGLTSAIAAAELRVRVGLGTTTVMDSGAITINEGLSDYANRHIYISGVITGRTSGTTGTVRGQANWIHDTSVAALPAPFDFFPPTTADTTIDTTIANDLNVSFEWGGANGSNDLRITNYVVYVDTLAGGGGSGGSGSGDIEGVTAGPGLSGGGTSGTVELSLDPNATHYIQNRNTLQSGATFYVSSGTVLNLGLGSDLCAGNANGGVLTTDANGRIVCEDDDSGGGGGGTTIWGQDDEAAVSNAVSTVTVNGVLKSTVTASSKMAIFLNYDTNQFENQASTFAAKSSSFTMQGPIVSSVSVPAIIGHESTIESVVDLSDLQGQIGDAQIADAAVDGGSGGEIADGSITAHDVDTSSFTLLGPSVTLGTETDGVYLASATAGSSMLITGTNNVESAAPIFNVDPSSVATRADMAALYQPLDATLTDLAAAPLGEDNSISVGAIAAGSLPSDVIASSVAVSAFFSDVTVRSNLGLAIGTNVQAYDADLDDLADGTLSASKVQQNAGTDITADLEEETHATEHADGGSDEITISTANMNATGTASATTFLRGDNTWSSPAGSGDAVLASTQTFSGINTFQSTTTFDGPVADGNGLPGTSGQVFTSNGPDANPTWQNPTGSGSTYDFLLSSWTTQGTFSYTVPSSAAVLNIWLCAGGGSGGGGAGANAGSARSGGSAGGGGACRMVTVSTQSAGATLYVVVGTGTIGGAGGSGVNGNPGSAGGTTIVYSVNNSTIGIVYGGAGGPGGNGDQAGGAGGGWGSAGSLATGGLPTATSNVHGFGGGGAGTAANQAGKVSDFGGAGGGSGDQTGNGANGGQSSYGGGGGGGAAGITAASPGVVGTSGAGGLSGHINSSQSGSGGAAGTGGGTSTPGTKGEDGFFWRGGFGGGGGGSDNDSTGSAGGNGGYCGGGGGGGGSGTNVGGRGGSGGPGCVFILPGV